MNEQNIPENTFKYMHKLYIILEYHIYNKIYRDKS